MTQTLLVNKADFGDVACVNAPLGDLQNGFIRCDVGPWALTANNITYMVTGDRIGYWQYFAPEAYGINLEGHGRMPVWGYAKVTESRCEDVEIGQTLYGFLPITQSFDMKPDRATPMSRPSAYSFSVIKDRFGHSLLFKTAGQYQSHGSYIRGE